MEIERFQGLPAHPLFVHFPVVMIPLLALGWILLIAKPGLRSRYGWIWTAFTALIFVMVVFTAGSGEKLLEAKYNGVTTPAMQEHEELGEQLRLIMAVLTLSSFLFVARGLWAKFGANTARAAAVVLTIVVAAGSIAAVVWNVRAAHAGSKVHWCPDSNQPLCSADQK